MVDYLLHLPPKSDAGCGSGGFRNGSLGANNSAGGQGSGGPTFNGDRGRYFWRQRN